MSHSFKFWNIKVHQVGVEKKIGTRKSSLTENPQGMKLDFPGLQSVSKAGFNQKQSQSQSYQKTDIAIYVILIIK